MLTNLKTGFLVVAAHGVGVAAVRIVSARFWGHAVDRIGAGPVVVFCSFGIAAVPLTWFFVTPDRLWPIALDAMLRGLPLVGPQHRRLRPDHRPGPARLAAVLPGRLRHRGRPGLRPGLDAGRPARRAHPGALRARRRGVEQPARALPALRGGPPGLRRRCRSACTTRARAATSASWSAPSPTAPASAPSARTCPRSPASPGGSAPLTLPAPHPPVPGGRGSRIPSPPEGERAG